MPVGIGQSEIVEEIDGSLDEYTNSVRREFERQFRRVTATGESKGPWVRDVFEDYVIVRDKEDYYKVAYTEGEKGFSFAPRAEWTKVKQVFVAEQTVDDGDAPDRVRETVSAALVSEFGGKTPSVPFAPGVDVADLTAGDDNPMFLVLPISETGKVSTNGLIHDDDLADTLVTQIMSDKPGGIMGHIPDALLDSAHPVSQIHWVGAVKADGKVWAKGYIPRTAPEVREEYRILKAKRGKAATSIFGKAVKELAMALPGRARSGVTPWHARNFALEQIDLAPYKRASLPGSGQFAITAEMATGEPAAIAEERTDEMDKTQVIAELSAADAKALPEAVRNAIIADYQATHEAAQRVAELEQSNQANTARVAELEQGVQERDTRIQELESQLERLAEFETAQWGRDLDAKIAEATNWTVNRPESQDKLDGLRKLIRQMVEAKLGTVREMDQAETALADLLAGDLKPVAETVRDALAGGAVIVGEQKRRDGTGRGLTLDDSPEKQKQDADWLGVN